MLIDCGHVAPAVQSGLLPPLLVRVLLDQYPVDARIFWRYNSSGIEQYEEAVMCSPVIYRSEMHFATSAKELRELPADIEHIRIPRWKSGSERVDLRRELERFPMLRALDLSDHRIDAEGLQSLAQSSCLRSLTSLGLESNRIGDEGLRALAESSFLRALTSLGLGENRIGAKGVRSLADSSFLRSLASLTLE